MFEGHSIALWLRCRCARPGSNERRLFGRLRFGV